MMTKAPRRVAILLATVVLLVVMGLGYFTARSVDTEVEIRSPVATVWGLLTDFSRYGTWNPFIVRVDGAAMPGSRLAVTIRPPVGGSMDFNLTLKEIKSQQEMIWTGRTLLPGLLDGEHYFRIERAKNGTVLFRQGERYSGALLYLAWPLLKWSVTRSFTEMNGALRNRAERYTALDAGAR